MYKRAGYHIVPETDLDEMCATVDPQDMMRTILRRLRIEVKRTNVEYQITHIHWPTPGDHRAKFEIDVRLEREIGGRMNQFTFTLNQDYPFQAPLRMTVNGSVVSHETYAALESMGGGTPPTTPLPHGYGTATPGTATPGTATPSAIGRIGLCDEVKRELGRACPQCLYCKLYRSGTWSPTKFLGTQVDEYLAVRAEIVGAIRRGVGRAKLMRHRVVLPEEIVEEILGWI